MKRSMLLACLLAVLLLLGGCGSNQLLKKTGYNLHLYHWDGQKTVTYWAFEKKDTKSAVKALKAVQAKEAPQWTADLAEAPLYGIELDTRDGTGLSALWSNGYWIDQEGNAWTFDFDFDRLIRETQWRSVWEREGLQVPCVQFVAQKEDGYEPNFLNPAEEPEAPENIHMTLTALEEDKVTVTLRNDSSQVWTYGRHWQLEVFAEDGWYVVPFLPGMGAAPDIGYVLQPGQTAEQTFLLVQMCGEQPAGQYRIVCNGLTVGFVLE